MRYYYQKRNGFAMIMAIFFMIVIATLLTYMLASTTETAKRTTNSYINEQAQLLAKSAVEYALLRVSAHNRRGGDNNISTADDSCINSLTLKYPDNVNPIFDIQVDIQYFGFGAYNVAAANCSTIVNNIQTEESNGTMLIDVYVSDNVNLKLSEPISYHRRTIQKL